MNALILYDSTQTYTNTVYEHLASFREHSRHRIFYAHVDATSELNVDLNVFDAVGIHYSIRLPFDQVSPSLAQSLVDFIGLKFLFIQDEYDFPKRAWYWINRLKIQLVFTVVPKAGIETVYPQSEFPNTKFVTNLTGYVPEILPSPQSLPRPSERPLLVGYRARALPIRYGQLGIEKVAIGQIFKTYCDEHGLNNDIAWSEEARIYGAKWYDFVVSCRSMLGSESGSNVFDWDGTLNKVIEQYRIENTGASDEELYNDVIRPREIDGLMNQVSPRIFEAIASKTILVLFEGNYSDVIRPGEHFIALKKDGSNLASVVSALMNASYVDAMANRAFQDVIVSGKYSYKSFVCMVDMEWDISFARIGRQSSSLAEIKENYLTPITTRPIRANPPKSLSDTLTDTFLGTLGPGEFVKRFAIYLWRILPTSVRLILKPTLKRLLGKV